MPNVLAVKTNCHESIGLILVGGAGPARDAGTIAMFNPLIVIITIAFYVGCLFAISLWVERKAAKGKSLVNNPVIYSLSLAVYVTTLTYYGTVDLAANSGMLFLTLYLGPTISIMLWWLILRKLVQIRTHYHINSIADLISARYDRSEALASIATVLSLCGVIPFIALQLKAILSTFTLISASHTQTIWYEMDVGPILIGIMILFTIILGVRRLDPTERHEGMVMAVSVESMVKLLGFLVVGISVTYFTYDGFADIFHRLSESRFVTMPSISQSGTSPVPIIATYTLLAMSSVLFLPHQFHVAVVENYDQRHILTAMWLFPVYMLLIYIFVFPIAAGGLLMGFSPEGIDFLTPRLMIIQDNPWLGLLVFIGGFAAATGMVMISAMTLSTMVTNHLVLPLLGRIRWLSFLQGHLLECKWMAVVGVLILSYWFEQQVELSRLVLKYVEPQIGHPYSMVSIGMISFAAVLQFVPTILGGIFWRKGNKAGALLGLSAGFLIWFYTLLMPFLVKSRWLPISLLEDGPWGITFLKPEQLFGVVGLDYMSHAVFWTMLFNIGLYIIGSLFFKQNEEEQRLAEEFVGILAAPPAVGRLVPRKAFVDLLTKRQQIENLLAQYLGPGQVSTIIKKGLQALGPQENNQIPITDFLKLYNEVERSLTGYIGAAAAHKAMTRGVSFDPKETEDLMDVYREMLADFRVTPEELREKIDYYQAKEELLTSHAAELKKQVEARTVELRTTNEELREAKATAEAATRAKEEFLANMSHEIRTPMSGVIGAADLALNEKLPPKVEHYLRIIRTSAESLLAVINDILDFSKIEADRLELETRPFRLEDVLIRVSEVFGLKAAQKKIELLIDIPHETPTSLIGDPLRLQQILANLVSNAIKFTKPGGIIIEGVKGWEKLARPLDTEQIILTIFVKDSGIGIAPEILDKLFKPFSQADTSTARKYGGSGLGLTICKKLVEMMGGSITAESQLDAGSTFTFTVRLGWQPTVREPTLAPPQDLQGLNVLVVDDCLESRIIAERMLRSFGYHVESVFSGKDSLSRLEKARIGGKPFDLVIMDWLMPEMDGIEVSRKIRRELNLDLPIIMMTAFGKETERLEAEKAGINAFLTKPITPSTFFNAIMDTFGKKAMESVADHQLISEATSISKERLKGIRILVAEDNPTNQEIASAILENAGIFVEIAANGKEAIKALDRRAFDGVLMDIQMPEMDGYEATRTIRKDLRFRSLPIIAMTAHAMKGDEEKCLDAGMDGYVSKPIDQGKLFQTLCKTIRSTEKAPPVEAHQLVPQRKKRPHSGAAGIGDLPASLPGINIQDALDRLEIDRDTFKRILNTFFMNNQDTSRKIKNAYDSKDWELLRQLSHSVKGGAANIGANELQAAAQELETTSNEATSRSPDPALVENVETALNQVLKSLESIVAAPESDDLDHRERPVGGSDPIPMLKRLADALRLADPTVVQKDLNAVKAHLDPSLLLDIETQINSYDYDKALETLAGIIKKMESSVGKNSHPITTVQGRAGTSQ